MALTLAPAALKRSVGTPWFAAMTAVVAAVVGILGSVYQDQIAASFPLSPTGPYGGVSVRAIIFWGALFLLAWFVYLRQIVDDDARSRLERSSTNVEATSQRIEELVETLPPRAFQAQLARAAASVDNAVSSVVPRITRPGTTEAEITTVIREILHAIAGMALIYDDAPLVDGKTARYSANLMLFSDAPPDAGRIDFFPTEYDPGRLRGVLKLRVDLSATSESGEEHEPDGAVPELTLPVPAVAERDGLSMALPGAPYAFLTGTSAGYDDSRTLPDWCRDHGDFRPSVQEALADYFERGPGREIRSFIARPLAHGLGVLNIHANRTALLGPRLERRETFQALLTPILQDLSEAVRALVAVESGSGLPGNGAGANIEKGGDQ